MIDQVVHRPGNLRAIWSFVRNGDAPQPASADALGVAAREFGLPPAWVAGNETIAGFPIVQPGALWKLLATALALLAVLAWVRRRGNTAMFDFVFWSAVIAVGSMWTLTNSVGLFYSYVTRWTWAVSISTATAAMSAVLIVARDGAWWQARQQGDRLRRSVRVVSAVAAGLVFLGAGAVAVRTVSGPLPDESESEAAAKVSETIRQRLPRGVYALRWVDRVGIGAVPTGAAVDLIGHGYEIRLPEDAAPWWGSFRVGNADGLVEVVLVARSSAAEFTPTTRSTLLATVEQLGDGDRRQLREAQDRIRSATGVDPADSLVPGVTPDEIDHLVQAGADPDDVAEAQRLARRNEVYQIWTDSPMPPA